MLVLFPDAAEGAERRAPSSPRRVHELGRMEKRVGVLPTIVSSSRDPEGPRCGGDDPIIIGAHGLDTGVQRPAQQARRKHRSKLTAGPIPL